MQTESLGQMLDRLVIAALKAWHFDHDHKPEAAELAREQVAQLCTAVEVYDWECRTGQRTPQVRRQLRYHNHNDVEAFRPGKQATANVPGTLSGCVVRLVEIHSTYWQAQSQIQTLKRLIDSAVGAERAHFEHKMVQLQRRDIDLSNQARAETVQQLDTIYAIDLGCKPDVDLEALKEEIIRALEERAKHGQARQSMEALRS